MNWAYIWFSDLHVNAATITRALRVLQLCRETALARGIRKIVCTGDFWDLRGTLNVRQLNDICDEFERWRELGLELILVPGNHDQVTTSGLVHGLRVFDAYPNIQVATDPILDMEEMIAFLPWREDTAEQYEMVEALDAGGWTIFGHLEVEGAISNTSHIAPGKVTVKLIESVARACYVGHYHDRQKIGKCTWYPGSPFEMNMGERNKPHGIAIVYSDRVDPEFIDFPEFPQHRRYQLLVQERKLIDLDGREDIPRAQDTVELLWPHGLDQTVLKTAISVFKTCDVRPVAIPAERDDSIPVVALTLDDAIEVYVTQEVGDDAIGPMLIELGKELLAEIPESMGFVAIGTSVEIVSVDVWDFCRISGHVNMDLDRGQMTLLAGPIGKGKTAFLDAITWCFYDMTTPRKVGGNSASFKGDDVINDHADKCEVQVMCNVMIAGESRPVVVRRTRKRKGASKVEIEGLPEADGVRDQQERIMRLIGFDYPIWRAAVSLGQGAVGNFLTGADKSQKKLLSTIHGLDAVTAAPVRVKARLAPCLHRLDISRIELEKEQRSLDEIRQQDFAHDVQNWDAHHAAENAGMVTELNQVSATAAQCTQSLQSEAQWTAAKAGFEASLAQWRAELAGLSSVARVAQLQQDIGSYRIEQTQAQQAQGTARGNYQKLMNARAQGQVPCHACGRPLDGLQVESQLLEAEQAISTADQNASTFSVRLSNALQELTTINNSGDSRRVALEAQIAEAVQNLQKCSDAINTFGQLRLNLKIATERHAILTEQLAAHTKKLNPFTLRQENVATRLVETEKKIADLKSTVAKLTYERENLEFWERGFSAKGLPVVVLRAALYDLEVAANTYLRRLTLGSLYAVVGMDGDDLDVSFKEYDPRTQELRERRYDQLSGGQRRCAELAFSPFGLGDVVNKRFGKRVSLLAIDELTTHLGDEQKRIMADILREQSPKSVIVIDHDDSMKAEFDRVFELRESENGSQLVRR